MSPRLAPPPRRRRLHRPPPGGAQAALTTAMVNRLMWRTGFGPTPEGRAALKGRSLHVAVNRLMAAPQGPLKGPAPVRSDGTPLLPNERDIDLVHAWCDRDAAHRQPAGGAAHVLLAPPLRHVTRWM